jgi:Fe2+ transport system protein FeoA
VPLTIISLDQLPKNKTGILDNIGRVPDHLSISQEEFEKRLLEIGFYPGIAITVLYEGPISRDPIAVQLGNCHTVALRRSEAASIYLYFKK